MTKETSSAIRTLKKEIAELKKEVTKLRTSITINNSALRDFIAKSLDGVVILNKNHIVMYSNYAAMNLFDRNITDLLGKPLDIKINFEGLASSKESTAEINIIHAKEKLSIAEVSVLEIEWNNEPSYLVIFRDITENKKNEEVLEYMSHHDYLTDLPNRVYFEKQATNSIQDAENSNEHMALLYIDLDNFKIINATYGHDVGDAVLKEIANMLRRVVHAGNAIARLGGDEFILILKQLQKPEHAAIVSQKILHELEKPINLKGEEIFINASIGIAVYPFGGTNVIDLIKNADAAMYLAKQRGKNQYQFFSAELNEQNEKNLLILSGLKDVLHREEFFLCYQPIVDHKNSRCIGIEALLRWQHSQLGLLLPNEFLPIAEEMGIMVAIGKWVVRQAMLDYNELGFESLFLSLNLSANEIDAEKIAENILNNVQEIGIQTNKIILELTETSILHRPESSIRRLKKLSDVGVRIAIDDYGTGYSSLSYIKRLPVSILKIDKSFIEDLGKDSDDTIIVKSTIQLAHNLGLKIIAEGVRTAEQLKFLQEHDCDYMQGFYFSKPLELKVLQSYIKKINAKSK